MFIAKNRVRLTKEEIDAVFASSNKTRFDLTRRRYPHQSPIKTVKPDMIPEMDWIISINKVESLVKSQNGILVKFQFEYDGVEKYICGIRVGGICSTKSCHFSLSKKAAPHLNFRVFDDADRDCAGDGLAFHSMKVSEGEKRMTFRDHGGEKLYNVSMSITLSKHIEESAETSVVSDEFNIHRYGKSKLHSHAHSSIII